MELQSQNWGGKSLNRIIRHKIESRLHIQLTFTKRKHKERRGNANLIHKIIFKDKHTGNHDDEKI